MISFSKLIIRITFILVVGTGIAAYVKLEWFRNFVDEIKNEYFLPKEAPFPIAESRRPKLIYLIADGTGSALQDHGVPKMEAGWIDSLVTLLSATGGKISLSYIDSKNANNGAPVYLSIPSPPQKPLAPRQNEMEDWVTYSKRVKEFQARIHGYPKDSIGYQKLFVPRKNYFISECESLLTKVVYARKNPGNLQSDVKGAMFRAIHSLNIDTTQSAKFLIVFSDLLQDTPGQRKYITIDSMPNITVLVVNPGMSFSGNREKNALFLEHPNQVLEIISKSN